MGEPGLVEVVLAPRVSVVECTETGSMVDTGRDIEVGARVDIEFEYVNAIGVGFEVQLDIEVDVGVGIEVELVEVVSFERMV
jgi:hypothetical protein